MRRAEAQDLSTLDPGTIALPASGERLLRDTLAPNLALRLRASGSRTWVVFGRVSGKTSRNTLGEVSHIPLDAARRMASAAPPPPTTTTRAPLFGPDARIMDVMPHFLKSGESGRWKAGTLRNMRAVADAHILPLLGRRKVREVSAEEVARWRLDIAARSTAVRMALSTLSGLMLYAEDHGLRDAGTNPCRGMRKKQKGHRGQLLPATTVKRLWQALERLQGNMPDACDAVRLLLLTGARRSEILSLEWDRIIGSRAVLEDSKSGPRTIWLNAPARAILDTRRDARKSRFVFPAQRSDGPIGVIDRQWHTIRKEADLGALRLHDLRHHFASLAVSNGIDLRLVGQLLGHHDIDSTLGYAHIATDALKRSATRVSGLIDRSMRGRGPQPATPAREARHG
ncbi:tyrosine-type recombinase/integrase [Sphingomonas sp. NIBR02145]|uniref:tyrosine-type recombinase/integrase n=1 Tax=Sphingomonas sp. NIBR02145 TaxID=3014784 RepID=UPI0022B4EBD6|nr:tyrosine-type recombinase/integrase [Sphingomonas sp. NIBR02145]WHU04269.1 tyrosine-type recombinase/integrase [Sphingomonas sp. NIBR02145]